MLGRDYSGTSLQRFFLRNYLPLLVSFEIWNAITFVVLSEQNSISVREWVMSSLLIGKEIDVPLWYMRLILVLYPLIPVFSRLLQNASRRATSLGALAAVILFSALPTLALFFPQVWAGGAWTRAIKVLAYCIYPTYLLIGYVLRTSEYKMPLLLLCVGALAGTGVTAGISYWTSSTEMPVGMLYWSLSVGLAAASTFLLCLRLTRITHRDSWVRSVAQSSYGIYLAHHPIMVLGTTLFASLYLKALWSFVAAPVLVYLLLFTLSRSAWCRRWMLQMH